jgi:hypothetical protein
MNPQILGAVFDPTSPFLLSTAVVLSFFKVLFLIGFGVYVVFAFAVIRQAVLMTRTLQTNLNLPLTVFSWIHFGLSVLLWLFAFFTL